MPGTLTYADLATFPDDGLRREIIDGELIVSPTPRLRHQKVLARLYLLFGNHVAQRGGGEVYCAPALVVEVLSNPRLDRVRKRELYGRFRAPEYWIVDPDADRIEVYRLAGDTYPKPEIFEPGDVLTYDRLPGLRVDLAELFARD